MKTVLILTYSFPPIPNIAAVRPEGLANYLPEFGYAPLILTKALPGPPDPKYQVIQTDYEDRSARLENKTPVLLKKSGKNAWRSLFRTKENEQRPYIKKMINLAGEVLSYPDGKKGWIPIVEDASREIFEKHKIQAIISSSPPATLHMIANNLKNRYQVPWIADFRDLWTGNPYYPYSRIRKFFEKKLEIKILKNADTLVTTSDPWARDLSGLNKTVPVETIYNGYKPETYEPLPLTKEFSITYAGSMYDGKRDPEQLFVALNSLIKKGKIDKTDVDVRFYGRHQGWLEQKIRENDLAGIAVQNGMVSRDESKKKQRESQLLLLLNWNSPKECGTYTGKVFEYLAAGRPILSIGAPKGVITQLLDETNAGKYALSTGELENIVLEYYKEYKKEKKIGYHGNVTEIEKYSHRVMAKKFAQILDKII